MSSDSETPTLRPPSVHGVSALAGLALPFRIMLISEAFATAAVGLWLMFVIATVLPARDPGHVSLWRAVATGCFAFSVLSWVCAFAASPALRRLLFATALVATAAGIYGIVSTVVRGGPGGHFEGYLLLMGLILSGHGLTAATYALLAGRLAGPPPAA